MAFPETVWQNNSRFREFRDSFRTRFPKTRFPLPTALLSISGGEHEALCGTLRIQGTSSHPAGKFPAFFSAT